jgi:hypothetical protein
MDYRKLWERYNGPIPRDDRGRSFEIHHIDGNRQNNSIDNLICLSIEEHYKLHIEQKDYFAAGLIANRLNLSEEEFRKLNENKKGRPSPLKGRKRPNISKAMRGRPSPYKGLKRPEISEAKKGKKQPNISLSKLGDKNPAKRPEVRAKISATLTGRKIPKEVLEKRSLTVKGRPKKQIKCSHCSKVGGSNLMKRWHFENCKHKTNESY